MVLNTSLNITECNNWSIQILVVFFVYWSLLLLSIQIDIALDIPLEKKNPIHACKVEILT